jgi:membrane protease YdiL (CAAX protease family)
VLAALAFGLAHYQGGVAYVILSSLAGLFYGWAYLQTGRLEAPVLTHFLLNFLHLTLFSYPALAR